VAGGSSGPGSLLFVRWVSSGVASCVVCTMHPRLWFV
jgi:hypothetical protein